MTEHPIPVPGLQQIAPYIPGRSKVDSDGPVHKLSSNESPLGPSPHAIEAYRSLEKSLAAYPDGAATELRNAIARVYGLSADNIICGAGSDDILNLIAHAFIGEGDEAVHTEHGFLVYPIAIRAAGGVPIAAPESHLTADVDAILERVTDRTRVVFLANPNNPTGTYLPISELRRLHQGLPDRVLFVVDSAYAEYVRRNDYESGIELAATTGNVLMTRTFSKIHGLAGLRLGWAYGPTHLIEPLHRIRGPFNVGAPAIAAGVAAIEDRAHVDRAVAHNDIELARVTEELAALGLTVTPSVANFVLVSFPEAKGRTAAEADDFLGKRGVILRRMEGYGLPNALRMSIGSVEANNAAIAALAEFLSPSTANTR